MRLTDEQTVFLINFAVLTLLQQGVITFQDQLDKAAQDAFLDALPKEQFYQA